MARRDTLAQTLARWLSDRPGSPIITYYGPDDARVELSAATAGNAVQKAANLFADDLLLEPGEVVWLALPCHWQVPVLAMGAWAAGLTVAIGPRPATASATLAMGGDLPAPLGLGLAVPSHPWGLPLREHTPQGWEDFAAMAQAQPDAGLLQWPAQADVWISAGGSPWTGAAVAERSTALAAGWGLPASGRLLTSLSPGRVEGLLACTTVPASLAGAAILAAGGDMGHIGAQERNDATATDV